MEEQKNFGRIMQLKCNTFEKCQYEDPGLGVRDKLNAGGWTQTGLKTLSPLDGIGKELNSIGKFRRHSSSRLDR